MSVKRLTPTTVAEASEMVARARAAGGRIVPVGAGTKRHWVDPRPPEAPELDMRGLNRVVEYSPEDMTITVEAGITIRALSERLAEHNQRITLDPPHFEDATIGGILAANDSGPVRFAYGTARDIVIGMSVIEPDGGIVKSGGKVVKNVAGYDLHKLFIGSFGTLGPIATVTFRLRPLPEARGLVVLQPREAREAERMMAEIVGGETRPTCIELLNARAARSLQLESRLTLIVGYEENADAVRWQCERLMQTFGGTALGDADSRSLYERLCALPSETCPASFKATMLSSEVADFLAWAEDGLGTSVRLVAHAGNGIVHGLLDASPSETALQALQAMITQMRGGLHLRGLIPPGTPRFSPPRPDARLSRGIREAFDPAGLFAPQRVPL